jgi:hypothetical protein
MEIFRCGLLPAGGRSRYHDGVFESAMTDTRGRIRQAGILLLGAIAVGTLDILYAIVFWHPKGVPTIRIFQSIAAGLYGKAAFTGGAHMAEIGAALHYFISLCIVLVYWVASKRIRMLTERPFYYGSIYGVLVWLFMNFVVIPLSFSKPPAFLFSWVAWSIVVHAFLIGVPAALTARTLSRRAAD